MTSFHHKTKEGKPQISLWMPRGNEVGEWFMNAKSSFASMCWTFVCIWGLSMWIQSGKVLLKVVVVADVALTLRMSWSLPKNWDPQRIVRSSISVFGCSYCHWYIVLAVCIHQRSMAIFSCPQVSPQEKILLKYTTNKHGLHTSSPCILSSFCNYICTMSLHSLCL